MEPFFLKNESFYLIEDWMKDHLVAGFTTRNGGRSEGGFSTLNLGYHVNDAPDSVLHNRKIVSELLDFPLNRWIAAEQTHDARIMKVTVEDAGRGATSYSDSFKGTDGFFTKESGILLTMCYADCVPLYFYAPKAHAIGLAHAGWKGTVKGIGSEMIRVFEEENIRAEDIFVVIGPSICENCYVVDDYVIKFVQNRLEDVEEKPYNLISGNQYQLDLKEANRLILMKAGIKEENIQVSDLCTSCQEKQFFSHRRDKGKTGRMMSFLAWKEDLQ
ncbi:peptidoglycan editing factor PgeF [Robertmurraya andreesenii]|uniref:Purine nucleoside phosphorylase n=1 Tax=Anoxybacillus andreesenii TaxID=1325932 RepID=A0ABT9V4Q4_9BACL|nr:peptidoglycan editing factor PgeF [Robertmurraya andreesenii]MDQ0155932.1 YfiH family protein [Robertmurraya andreesenii]